MNDMTFKVKEDGVLHTYTIVNYFKNEKNNKDYVVYYEEDPNELYASGYEIENNELCLLPIETDEEWDYIDKVMEENHV